MRKVVYRCSSIDKVDRGDMLESRKDAKLNQSFWYRDLDKQMILNSIKVLIYQVELHQVM